MRDNFDFINYRQQHSYDCGQVCMRILMDYYNMNQELGLLHDMCSVNSNGISYFDLANVAESLGFISLRIKTTAQALCSMNIFPCILHVDTNHYVVLYKVFTGLAYISNPARGFEVIEVKDLKSRWYKENEERGAALLLFPDYTIMI